MNINVTDKEGDSINRVLVINKKPEEQKHIREILKNAATEITCVTSIDYAIIELSKKNFDFIILDASFTETDGSALIDAFQDNTQIPILILSLRAGKDADSTNPADISVSPSEIPVSNAKNGLLLAQHILQCNERYEPPGAYCYTLAFGNDLVIEPSKRQAYLKGKKLNLTRKEFDMLLCLASNPGRVLTREQLYRQIWETDTSYNVDELVKAHIKTLRKKLSDADIQYIKNVWGVGYRFDHETEEDGE